MAVTSTVYGSSIPKAVTLTGTEEEVMAALANKGVHAHQVISATLSGTTMTARYIKP
ncbi:MAG: hypothetical protein ACOC5T_04375 [Elusimicrobiota bacterium]